MSCSVSIVPSAQRINLEERALLKEQRPVREKILAMDADPGTHLRLVVAVELPSQPLALCDVKGSLPPSVPRMNVRFLVAFTLLRAHRYENAVEQRQRSHFFS